MKRDVINIDESKCNGCGQCVPNCAEGAIQVINGKARLISDLFCDGLGACVGHCPQGAMTIEKREAEPYDEKKVMKNVVKGGDDVIGAHIDHLKTHGQDEYVGQALEYLAEHKIPYSKKEDEPMKEKPCGCPGSRTMDFRDKQPSPKQEESGARPISELRQWPVQLHLINPHAPYFKDADLAVVADCVPFAYADFHRRFLKDKALVIFCPKLDDAADAYVEKLTALLKDNNVKSVTIVHMEVPCCFGVEHIVREAVERSGKNIILKEYTISLRGEIA